MCVMCHRHEVYTVEKSIEFSTPDVAEASERLANRPIKSVVGTVVGNAEEAVIEEPAAAPTLIQFGPGAVAEQVEKKKYVVSLQWKQQHDQLQAEINFLAAGNEALQAENARRKVEVSTMSSQITSLSTQQVALQLANSQLASEKDTQVKQLEAFKKLHESTMHDQLTLQCLHEQLSSEYDGLVAEKEMLKTHARDLKIENRDLKETNTACDKRIAELTSEIEMTKRGIVNLTNLRAEHSKLKDDFRILFTSNERMKQEYKNIQESYRNIRSENGRLKLQNTEMTGELNNRVDQITGMEIEFNKTTQRCEVS
jgi:DNA repair exonuclease SbcCD ATPase subunit